MSRLATSTFSIVARDPETGDLGVAVASKFLAVGAVVPWAQAEVGAVATQAWANARYGPLGLAMMTQGLSAQEALEALISGDPQHVRRQAGLVDAQGRAAAYTGQECTEWAGHLVGEGYTCQGNILAGEAVLGAMAEAFETAKGGPWGRLIAALEAGQEAGGDRRGQQSAALLIVRKAGGYGGLSDRFIDLRVDDHPTPITELKRLLELHKLYLFPTDPQDLLPLNEDLVRELQQILHQAGYYRGPITGEYDEATRQAFWDLVGVENLEERWCEEGKIDRVVLESLRQKF
jgi:uncharacterized Ntn-hydrolase superfamily protein